jgi:DNA replication protein DnaC
LVRQIRQRARQRPEPTPLANIIRLPPPLTPEREAERQREQAEWEARERAKRIDDLLRPLAADLGSAYANLRLADYQIYDPRQQEVVDRLRAIMPTMPSMVKEGRGIVWAGATGTGKDFLAACTATATVRLHEIPVRRLNARKLAIASYENAERLVEEFSRAPVLIVSDPAPTTAIQIDRLFALMTGREENNRPTWLTINGTADEIEASLGPALFGRFVKNSVRFLCDWEDYRQRMRKATANLGN